MKRRKYSHRWNAARHTLWVRRYFLEGSVLLLLLYVVATKEVIVTVAFNGEVLGSGAIKTEAPLLQRQSLAPRPVPPPVARQTGYLSPSVGSAEPDFHDVAETEDPAPHISNLTLVLSPDYAQRKNLPESIVIAKRRRVQQYIDRYADVARREMHQFGIPASITLAQGLLESNAGDSKLARESGNHFGIKCKRKCRGCTCRNYSDDTHFDMFRVFEDPLDSFREHSQLLQLSRYRKLKSYGKDYEKWAHGLKRAGYATDKRYGYKLVRIIEALDLTRFDID